MASSGLRGIRGEHGAVFNLFQRGRRKGPAASLVGRTIEKYRVLEPLGRGGMAEVYRAYHPQLDRHVAIKVLRADLIDEDEVSAQSWRARFQREARAVAALRHPNIVRVFDCDAEGDVSYIAMECLEGDCLKTRLADYRVRGDKMALGDVVRILLDVLDGLAYAHGEGVVHRDLKPANVLLTERGDAVLSDFGIAQIVGGTRYTVPGAVIGTVDYMSPEQARGGHGDARSDIYSLGIILYEMLIQRPPFEAEAPLAVLMKHVNDPLPLPCEIAASIPKPLECVILKALAKDPDDRYQSAPEMAQALRGAANQSGIDLPERISLAPSFTAQEAPSQSVGIFSGGKRERMPAVAFARDRTQPMSDEASPLQGTEDQTNGPLIAELPWSILLAVGVPLVINGVAFAVASVVGWEHVFSRGWPAELLLIAGSLSLAMGVVEAIWMLAPIGVVAASGVILLYTSFTGNWHHWIFLWVFELWAIAGVGWLTVWVMRHIEDRHQRQLSRVLGRALALVLFTLGAFVLGAAVIAVGASTLMR